MNVGIVMPEHPNQPVDLKHPAVRNWFWARELFRRLGFPPGDLYFCSSPTEPPRGLVISVVLRTQGREFMWNIGLVETVSQEQLGTLYEQWVGEIKRGVDMWDLDEFFSSWAFDKRVTLLTSLFADNIRIPGGP